MFNFLNSGKLEKIKICGYLDINHTKDEKKFEAFINPDEFTLNYNSHIEQTPVVGQTGTSGNFLNSAPLDFTLKFFLDGTKASGVLKNSDGAEISVAEKIIEFYAACGYEPQIHRTRYIRIIWGESSLLRFNPEVFQGCLKSASVNYKLFKPDGTPLRAIVNASFIEVIPPEQRDSAAKTASPDLTHVRVVNEGDTLPGMAQKIYGDFSYYFEVAKANGLTDFRNLQPGTKIFFPPFDKKVKTTKANA